MEVVLHGLGVGISPPHRVFPLEFTLVRPTAQPAGARRVQRVRLLQHLAEKPYG